MYLGEVQSLGQSVKFNPAIGLFNALTLKVVFDT
jgi:hypothetical protein